MNNLRVIGQLGEVDYHRAVHIAQVAYEEHRKLFNQPTECIGLMEYQWLEQVEQLKKDHGGEMWRFTDSVVVFNAGQLVGGIDALLQWIAHNDEDSHDTFSLENGKKLSLYESQARDAYNDHISSTNNVFVFMDVCVDGDLVGRLVFELYQQLCPRTCQNFVSLCKGDTDPSTGDRLGYVNSTFHRIVPNGWIQGGDICGGTGAKGTSIYGPTFDDESFSMSHSSSGVLGMANHGRNTNNSQFYITLQPAMWMDRQYVAFGRVVEGKRVLNKLESLETYNERPKQACQVSNCGLLPLKK